MVYCFSVSLKRHLIILFLIIITNIPLISAPIKFYPVHLKQPDGKIINVFLSGDEYYNWVHDSENYTIIQDQKTGYYTYADLRDDQLIPTNYVVGVDKPVFTGLKRGINISITKVLARKRLFLKNTPNNVGKTPTIGTINNLVIFIRFSAEQEFTDTKTTYDTMFNNNISGTNSLYNYFKDASYNSLSVTSTFYPQTSGATVISYLDSHTRNYYQPFSVSNSEGYQDNDTKTLREHTLLKNAIDNIASQVPTSLNLDGDNDGNVDNVCFIISGDPGAGNDLLWPHRWSLFSFTVNINGKKVYDYNLQLQNHIKTNGAGVLCHEMFHSLGAPDLYHYSYDGLAPISSWDLMEDDLNPPQNMCAYMKFRYGKWINSIPIIINAGTYLLNPLTSSTNNCFRINSPNSSTEYYMVEYRKKASSWTFESQIPGSGLIIYRINSAQDGLGNSQGPPDEVYAYRPNGTLSSNGNPDNAFYNSQVNRIAINDGTNPSGFLSNNNPGGLSISEVGPAGETISFRVGLTAVPFSSAQLNKTTYTPGETATLTITLANQLTNASVSFTCNGNAYTCNEIGNGVYTKSFTAPLSANLFSINIQASKTGYATGTYQTNLEVKSSTGASVTLVSGNITQNTSWTVANSPYELTGNVTVNQGIILSVEPGVIIRFRSGLNITVNGGLTCNGSSGYPIILTSASLTIPSFWGGIQFNSTAISSACIMNYCKFYYGGKNGYGYVGYPILFDLRVNPTITNTTIDSCRINAIALWGQSYTENVRILKYYLPLWLTADLTMQSGAVLTIDAGNIIKMPNNLTINGGLIANGTITDPIIFTSYKDDYRGGDSNGDGTSSPLTSDWAGIQFNSTAISSACIMNYCKFYYGGKNGYGYVGYPILFDLRVNPTITSTTIDSCRINAIALIGGSYNVNIKIPGYSLPLWPDADITVEASAILTIDPGALFKMSGNINIKGGLIAEGTPAAPIIFTSYKDDARGGDSNGDGTSQPQPGNWGHIQLYNTAIENSCRLSYCKFYYAGSNVLYIDGTDPLIQNTTIDSSSANGIYLVNAANPDLGGGIRGSEGNNIFLRFIGISNKYAIYNDGTSNIYAKNNNWGTSSSSIISSGIYDYYDNSVKGIVYYYPFSGIGNSDPVCYTKIFLQGPYNNGTMTTNLKTSGYLPLIQPYNNSPFNYSGTESVSSIPSGVVDWILLELRSTTTTIVAQRAAFLRSDGMIADLDGVSPVIFPGLVSDNYYLVVKHRNHLAIMSANPVLVSPANTLFNFTTAQTQAFGTNSMKDLGSSKYGLYSGDANGDGTIKYNGANNDRGLIYSKIGSGNTNNVWSGYSGCDLNLDGDVKYNGSVNDRAIIYTALGSGSTTVTISTQVPSGTMQPAKVIVNKIKE